jgi:DNA-binding transcriptional regulator GbsR (MarR family)
METVFDIFTSRARGRILRTLYFQKTPIPLRHVALISDLPVYSVQNALATLRDEEIIHRIDMDNNALFELNTKHPFYPILTQLFTAETNAKIQQAAELSQHKAEHCLNFASSTQKLLRRAKGAHSL